MHSTDKYYTSDITLLPVGFIWRSIWRLCCQRLWRLPFAPPLFLYVLLRKVLRWRHTANHASPYPLELSKVPPQAVPDEVLKDLAPCMQTLVAGGFAVVMWTHPDNIGNKQVYGVFLLHESGLACASVAWIRMSLSDQMPAVTVFGCHSFDQSDMHLDTSPIAEPDWIPEFIPPATDMLRLPGETTASETIRAHFERISTRRDLLRLDALAVERQILAKAQATYDHMIEKRFWVPITAKEYVRLAASSDVIVAELV